MIERFVGDDVGYIRWLAGHPDGFVLNTYPHVTAAYLVLHRAACGTVNRELEPGRSWTTQYGKACADDRDELEAWALARTGKAVKPHRTCLPGGSPSASVPAPREPRHRSGGGRRPVSPGQPILFDGDPIRVVVPRGGSELRPRLVIDGAQWLAETFFLRDPSAVGTDSYDAWIRETQADPSRRDRLSDQDVTAVNTTMAARTSHEAWRPVVESEDQSWLSALDPDWDLLEAPEADVPWPVIAARLTAAFDAIKRPGLGFAVTTKVLHIKRPRLIPVMDSVVIDQIGAHVSGDIGSWVEAIGQVRTIGRANLAELRAIRDHLLARGIEERTLVRILDALLWVSSPGAGLFDELDGWERVFRPRSD